MNNIRRDEKRKSVKYRIIEEARYIVKHNATIRQCADYFGISKTQTHKDMNKNLWYLDSDLYIGVRLVLDTNFNERHIRGGMATKKKYETKGVNNG